MKPIVPGMLHKVTGYLQQTFKQYSIVKLDLQNSFFHCVAFSIYVNCCYDINRLFVCGFNQLATAANKPSFDIIWPVVPCYILLPTATALLLRNIA